MTPHGRAHCNDLKVRAPSSRAANPTMMVRGWPATSGEVTTTPWRGRVTSTALKKAHIRVAVIFPRGTLKVPSSTAAVEQVSEGWPALEDGAPKMNQAGPSTLDARSRGAPCGARVFRSSLSAEADGRNRSMSSSRGATQVSASFHPKVG